jgi:nucleotide-binding universal stress UspA family protein
MKILVAYEGSECSDAAIMDLRRAGLPAAGVALVLSVAEMSHRLAAVPYGAMAAGPGMYVPPGAELDLSGGRELQEAQELAAHAAERLRADFPGWRITTEAWVDSPGSAIIRKTRAWQPDLVVLGSHGRSGFRRMMLGSVSQHVLHHVACSVRISRHRLHSQERPIRLIAGVDGSIHSKTAVRAMAARKWPAGAEARVVGVLDTRVALACASTLEGTIPVDIEEQSRRRITGAVQEAVAELSRCGLRAVPVVVSGKPADALLNEAEKWAADGIFVGAKGHNALERLLLGSISMEVASKSHCSVDVVRA